MKDWSISDIEKMTQEEARNMAIEEMTIKEHEIYFVDFGGYFKYSCLVFKDGHHIYHANDYELHHTGRTREYLRRWYIDTMSNKLFTEKEILQPVKDYDEYRKKEEFLRNYYGMRIDYISMFRICHNEKEERQYEKDIAGKVFDPVGFFYTDDKDFVKKHCQLLAALKKAKEESEKSFDYMKKAFLREMFNHEYGINWQADYDTLSAFGRIMYSNTGETELNDYFRQLNFTEEQKRAYFAARKEYYETTAL